MVRVYFYVVLASMDSEGGRLGFVYVFFVNSTMGGSW